MNNWIYVLRYFCSKGNLFELPYTSLSDAEKAAEEVLKNGATNVIIGKQRVPGPKGFYRFVKEY